MAGKGRSTTQRLLKRSGEFAYAFFCHLQLMVVGAVTWTASRLLLTAYVQSKVLRSIICLVAVHVVDALFRGKRSADVRGHDKPVFHDRLLTALHGAEVFNPIIRNGAHINENVPGARKFFVGAVSTVNPLVLSGLQLSPSAFTTKALKVLALDFHAHLAGRTLSGISATWASDINKHFAFSIQTTKAHVFANSRMFNWGVVRNASHVYCPFF